MLKIALLILTLTEDGATRVNLTPAEDADDCVGIKTAITSVFEAAEVTSLAVICGPTDLELTPFEHGAGPEDEIHRYRVEVHDDGKYLLTPLAEGASCAADVDASPAIHCARSSQSVLMP